MQWWDYFKIFTYAFTDDPLSKEREKFISGAGVSQSGAIPDIRAGQDGMGGGSVRLRDTTEFIDMSTVSNRLHRLKEYERLRSMPEIEMAMTVMADETCLDGDTLVATPHGFKKIKDLTREKEKFLVYCYDTNSKDFTLGWASDARWTKKAKTIKISMDDGSYVICTPDHRIFTKKGQWIHAGLLSLGDELMPFYRLSANQDLTKLKTNQYARVCTSKGWKHERQIVDEWSSGKEDPSFKEINKYCRMIAEGLSTRQLQKLTGSDHKTIKARLEKNGFTNNELKWLGKKKQARRIIRIQDWEELDVYDMTVEKHHNFCTNWGVVHNCQRDESGRVFQISAKNEKIKKELEYFLFHRTMLNLDQKRMWDVIKRTYIQGDFFWEIIIDMDDPKKGIIGLQPLPADSMYRLETTKGRLIEFQQSKEGPDYQSVTIDVPQATDADLQRSTAIRFAPHQIIHIKLGDDRETFYPYGVSLIEPARGPAHQLRLMEDSMVVYRLSRSPERRVFYIDTYGLPSGKAEAFLEKMKDQFRKRKVPNSRSGLPGASAVDERWHAPAIDEDYWIPIRPNSNTRVDTLPGACLSLDTKIPLLDGRTLTLSDIINEHEQGKELWTYSCDPQNGKICPGKITWAGITRRQAEVMKITLDNGKNIICTPDHKFPVLGKGFVESRNLAINESLIPYNVKMDLIRPSHKNEYTKIYDPSTKKWVFVHRMVAEFFKSMNAHCEKTFSEQHKNSKKCTIHHNDLNRFNNNPDNLKWMNSQDHINLHKWLGSEYALAGGMARAKQLADWKGKNDPKYKEFLDKSKNYFDNWRKTLTKEQRESINENISQSIKEFWKNLSVEDRKTFEESLRKKGIHGNISLNNLLKSPDYRTWFGNQISEGFDKIRGTKTYFERSKKISENNKKRWSDADYKRLIFEKQTIVYPKALLDAVQELAKSGLRKSDVIKRISQNKELLNLWASHNLHIKRTNVKFEKITKDHLDKMIKINGYSNWKHFKEEVALYNHRIVSIEYLSELRDTGTLTIDGEEEFHDYHTFALDCGVFTKNSNLGEVDDTIYFRNKLFTALNFPKNFFNNEDTQSTRITLSAQDVKFARMIERFQATFQEAIWEICNRHLTLMGYPEEDYDDLEIKMTPPSDWRELTRTEVTSGRIQNAGALKGSMILSDFDILTEWMKYPEEQALKMMARLKLQKLEELKLQIIAQNPTLLGVGLPDESETEVGSQPGGPNPMLGDEPPQDEKLPGFSEKTPPILGNKKPHSGNIIPDPTEEDIQRFNLDITDFESEMDEERPEIL